ncbi:MAG: SDR family oxidoreductase [Phycisphaeraceae bacterium]
MNETRTALITGAGSGIGRCVALQLSKACSRVALVGRTASKLEETAAMARDAGATAESILTLAADVSRFDAWPSLIENTLAAFGRINALANVAGFASITPIDHIDELTWRDTIDINLAAIVAATHFAWPHLKKAGGVIVNVSSMASVDPFPSFAMYAAAKAAVNMFTQCTAREGAEVNIKAVAVAPGAVETPMLRSMFDEAMIPKGHALWPDDVARVIVDCITGARDFKAGETILVPSA